MFEIIKEIIVPFEGAVLLNQIGFCQTEWTAGYAMRMMDVDNEPASSCKYSTVNPGDCVMKSWITEPDDYTAVIPAPTASEAFEYISNHCFIDIKPCKSEGKFYFRLIKCGAVIMFETSLRPTITEAVDCLFNDVRFRKFVSITAVKLYGESFKSL